MSNHSSFELSCSQFCWTATGTAYEFFEIFLTMGCSQCSPFSPTYTGGMLSRRDTSGAFSFFFYFFSLNNERCCNCCPGSKTTSCIVRVLTWTELRACRQRFDNEVDVVVGRRFEWLNVLDQMGMRNAKKSTGDLTFSYYFIFNFMLVLSLFFNCYL